MMLVNCLQIPSMVVTALLMLNYFLQPFSEKVNYMAKCKSNLFIHTKLPGSQGHLFQVLWLELVISWLHLAQEGGEVYLKKLG